MTEEAEVIVSEGSVDVTPDPMIIQEARDMGWVPLEEFRGDGSKWRSADEFVERGREILPILRKNNAELLKDKQKMQREIAEMRETFEEFKEYRKADKDRAYKQALEDLKSRKVEAIEAGNGELVVEIDEAISEIKEEAAKPIIVKEVKVEPQVDPILQDWLADNEWFEKIPSLQYAANAAGAEILEQEPGLKGRKFLDKVAEKVKERYPEKFSNPRTTPAAVEGSQGGNRGGSKKKTYESLPADAKSACDRYVKQGLMTREEYVRDYEWGV